MAEKPRNNAQKKDKFGRKIVEIYKVVCYNIIIKQARGRYL